MEHQLGAAGQHSIEKPLVYFFCLGNSIRSQMAEGFLRARAGALYEAASGGVEPLGHVLPETIRVMKEVGIDVRTHTSDPIDPALVAKAHHLIDLGGHARRVLGRDAQARLDEWPVGDPYGRGLVAMRAVRDEISQRVDSWLEQNAPMVLSPA